VGDRPVTPAERRVLDLVTRGEVVSLTRALVQARGQNPPGDEAATVRAVADACVARCLHPVLSEVEPGRCNVTVQLSGGDGPGLLLLGHTDVVPVGDGWTRDPWGGSVEDGRLFGRGAADMKGGLAAALTAMSALRRAGVRLSGPVELAAVVDEEETGKGIRHYLAERDRSRFQGCVVAEPTDLQTVVAARGDCYVEVEVRGRAAHSGSPGDGASAVYGAASVISAVERRNAELAHRAHALVGPPTWSVGLVSGGSGASVVPASSTVTADRRLLPGETSREVLAECAELLAGCGLAERGLTAEARVTMEMPGFETPADSSFVVTADASVSSAGGPGRPLGGWTAACDGGFVARDAGVPVVVLGPGSVASQAHRPDESVAVDDLVVAARTYALIALRTLAGDLR
jgi:acetylornithine deacetylase/succinyl-diaminopimelate desuccinylase family protein